MRVYNKKNVMRKRRLLRKNQTVAEKQLWGILRGRKINGYKFRGQFSIGEYICDFYCPELKLVIEIDGGQHFTKDGKEYDKLRTQEMSGMGIKVIRYGNEMILDNIDWVRKDIQKNLALLSLS